MAVQKTGEKYTYEDYAKTPEGEWFEVHDGAPIPRQPTTTSHQRVLVDLGVSVYTFIKGRELGEAFWRPLDVVLTDCDIVQPDFLFVSNERRGILTELNIRGAPDLVVEILSPDTAAYDKGYKRDLYEKHGVKEYWMADVDSRTITVLRLNAAGVFELAGIYGEGDAFESSVLVGFTLNVSEVFGGIHSTRWNRTMV